MFLRKLSDLAVFYGILETNQNNFLFFRFLDLPKILKMQKKLNQTRNNLKN
jgi:hypothetical protein